MSLGKIHAVNCNGPGSATDPASVPEIRTFRPTGAEGGGELGRRMAQLRALAAQVHRAEQRERARLAQILHDDLQQLLVAAMVRLEGIPRSGDPSALASEVRQLIRQAIETSRSLTADLNPAYLRSTSIVRGLHLLAGHMLVRHGLTVEVEAHGDLDVSLSSEQRVVLLQSTRELLFNVVKHSGVRSARVDVSIDPGWLKVVVEDRGRGFRASGACESNEATGLGLVGMRERLEYIGCSLLVESQPGAYTRVTIAVPFEDASAGARSSRPAGSHSPASAPGSGDRVRVLLADNHCVLRESLGALLRAQGDIEIVGEASDGCEAVDMATRLKPDVIVMDVGMPGMDGIDATRAIIEKVPDVRIVSLTRHEEPETTAAMLEAGAEIYLTKGGPAEDLITAIRGERNTDASG
jgi:CheY-like chemotaxis protein